MTTPAASATPATAPSGDCALSISIEARGDINIHHHCAPVKPLDKLPHQYREMREYASDDEDSRYEITYRFNRIA